MIRDPHPDTRGVRDAASLLVVRDGASGVEVLLLRRAERSTDRMSGACVFPGGAVDADDRYLHAIAQGPDDATASRLLDLPVHGLDFAVAAVRECFEESGLLFVVDQDDALVALDRWDEAAVQDMRGAVRDGGRAFERLCVDHGWRLAVDRLAYCGHWLTPAGVPKRFDTRFFAAVAPEGQVARADGHETTLHVWVRPADALQPDAALHLMQITRHMLRWMAGFTSAAECVAHARGLQGIRRQVPRIGTGRAGRRTILPGEPVYAELGRLDPDGTRHDARLEIEPGVAVRLSPSVIRVTAPNPGMMTGPGTNSYLVGGGAANEWAVIDPGPDDPAHLAALLAAAPGVVRWILVTHTHRDHSPGCVPLRQATGARVIGRRPAYPERQDATFQPDHEPLHGERIDIDGLMLRVVHTPGHASNHVCYLLEAEKTLFTGDHVMQGSTVVVDPPDGDMAAYLASLEALLPEDIDWLAPGHGFLIGNTQAALRGLIRHRRAREAKVIAALERSGRSGLESLVVQVYDDVDRRLHGVAQRSLLAHLQKLVQDGVVDEGRAGWGVKSARD